MLIQLKEKMHATNLGSISKCGTRIKLEILPVVANTIQNKTKSPQYFAYQFLDRTFKIQCSHIYQSFKGFVL